MKKGALILILLSLIGCTTYLFEFETQIVDTNDRVKVKVLRKLSPEEIAQSKKAVRYVESLLGDKFEVDYGAVYVVKEMRDYEALTRKSQIFIGENNLIKEENWFNYLRLGVCIGHEQSHCRLNLNEKETRARVDDKIVKMLKADLTFKDFSSKFDALK